MNYYLVKKEDKKSYADLFYSVRKKDKDAHFVSNIETADKIVFPDDWNRDVSLILQRQTFLKKRNIPIITFSDLKRKEIVFEEIILE